MKYIILHWSIHLLLIFPDQQAIKLGRD
jgi:hypothetical protein